MSKIFKSIIGHSEDIDSNDAADELISQCTKELGDDPAIAGILFSHIDNDLQLIINKIKNTFPNMQLIGATTDGEISSKIGFSESSIVLQIFTSNVVEISTALAKNVSSNPEDSIKNAVKEALNKLSKKPVLCLTFPESLTISGSTIVTGLKSALGNNFPIIGGTAADSRRIVKTYQFYETEVLTDSVPIMLFSEPIQFSFGRVSGWEPLGKFGVITKSNGNTVIEIDNKPALDFFSHYLGDMLNAPGVYAEYPLIIDSGEGSYQITPLSIDKEKNEVTFFSELPEGSKVRLSEADRDMIVDGTRKSISNAVKSYPGSNPSTAIILSCAARKGILGTRTREEGNILLETLPEITMSGFYTYGEIAPECIGSSSQFNNEMFVTLLLGI